MRSLGATSDPPRARSGREGWWPPDAPRMTNARPGNVRLERRPYDPASWDAIVARHPDAEVFHGPCLAVLPGGVPGCRAGRRGRVRRRDARSDTSSGASSSATACGSWAAPSAAGGRWPWASSSTRAWIGGPPARPWLTFAFRDLGCLHVELGDRRLTADQLSGSGSRVEAGRTFVVDLEPPEEAILAGMRSTTGNYIRQGSARARRQDRVTGATFADEYHEQLVEVFARQGLVPTYDVERVRRLIRCPRASR